MSELPGLRSLQWTPEPAFADWLGPRLAPADVVHTHMVGAWWAAARGGAAWHAAGGPASTTR